MNENGGLGQGRRPTAAKAGPAVIPDLFFDQVQISSAALAVTYCARCCAETASLYLSVSHLVCALIAGLPRHQHGSVMIVGMAAVVAWTPGIEPDVPAVLRWQLGGSTALALLETAELCPGAGEEQWEPPQASYPQRVKGASWAQAVTLMLGTLLMSQCCHMVARSSATVSTGCDGGPYRLRAASSTLLQLWSSVRRLGLMSYVCIVWWADHGHGCATIFCRACSWGHSCTL